MSNEAPAESSSGGERPGIGRILRRRLPILLAAGVGVWLLSSQVPKDTTFVYRLGARAEALSTLEVRVSKLPDAELVRSTEFRFDATRPAPAEQAHAVSLVPGDYRLDVQLRYPAAGGETRQDRLERTVTFDGEERITLSLEP